MYLCLTEWADQDIEQFFTYRHVVCELRLREFHFRVYHFRPVVPFHSGDFAKQGLSLPISPFVMCRMLLGLLAALSLANGQASGPLASLSLEELLSLDVTSVGKKRERLDRAAAAVFVITQEDIRRMGATSIPEALMLAPGLHVARVNSRTWAITARGFNSVFSNKLLVMIDGRSIYSPLFTGVWWDQDVMIDDVDRIEVIRGPAAAIWGANAVNGVINIITRKTRQTVGNLLSVTAGTEDRSITRVRHGAEFGKTGAYRVYGQYSHRFLASPAPQFGDSYWGTLQGGFRVDFDAGQGRNFMLQGDIGKGTGTEFEHNSYPVFLPGSVFRLRDQRRYGSLLGRMEATHRSGAQTDVQIYFDDSRRFANEIAVSAKTLDTELQHRRPIAEHHELILSAGYRGISDHTVDSESTRFLPPERTYGIGHISAVDGISLWKERVQLTAGARMEHNPFSGWSIQPTARAQWSLRRTQSLWGALSRAIRAPARLEDGFERFYRGSGFGFRTSPDMLAETLFAVEAGYRGNLRKNLSLDVAVFRNRYEHLRSSELESMEIVSGSMTAWFHIRNLVRARSWGGEAALTWNPTSAWRLSGSYTGLWMQNRLSPGSLDIFWLATARATPVHQWQSQSSLQLRRSLHWNTNLYYYGTSRIDQRGDVPPVLNPAQIHIDTRLAFRREATEWSFGIRNLTADKTEYFIEPGPAPDLTRRAFYCRLTWWF